MTISSSNRRIAKNTVFLYGRLLLVLLVSLYTVRVVLNALGVVDYGVYNVVGGFVSMFGFLNTSMANATQRFYNFEIGKNGNDASIKVYNAALKTQTILAIGLFILCELLGVWYLNTAMELPRDRLYVANWLLQFSILSLIFMIIQVPYSSAALAYEKMDFYAIVGIVDVFLKFFIAVVVQLYSGDRLMLYGVLLLFISVTNFALYYYYVKRKFQWLIYAPKSYSYQFQQEMLSFSGWNLLGSFSWMLRSQGFNLLLNYFFGVIINAANGISGQIYTALQYFSTNIIIAFKPQLVHSYAAGDLARVKSMMYMMTNTSFCLLYMLSIPMILNMNYILNFWLGNNLPEYTVTFSVLIIITLLITSFFTPLVQLIHATGRIKNFQIASSIVICSIIPLSWLAYRLGGVPEIGYIISIILFCINQIVGMFFLKKVFPYSFWEYTKKVGFPCLLFAILMPIIPTLASNYYSNFIGLLLTCITSCFVSLLLFSFIILNKENRTSIKNFLINRLKLGR